MAEKLNSGDTFPSLTLQLVVEQSRAAKTYLQQLDPKNDDSGTGAQAYGYNSLHVRSLRATLDKPQNDWQRYLDVQLQALNLMVDGFRALSDKRNQAAATHTTRLLERYSRSLVVLMMS